MHIFLICLGIYLAIGAAADLILGAMWAYDEIKRMINRKLGRPIPYYSKGNSFMPYIMVLTFFAWPFWLIGMRGLK